MIDMFETESPEDRWAKSIAMGWSKSAEGNIDEALAYYRQADEIGAVIYPGHPFALNPELSLLRHAVGRAPGIVRPLPPSEDLVVQVGLRGAMHAEADDAHGMTLTKINAEKMEAGIRGCIETFDPAYHTANIHVELPHVQFLSTGRCGTISIYHLLERSKLLPYHGFPMNSTFDSRYEQVARIDCNQWDSHTAAYFWAATRAAEWIGCCNVAMPMADLCHLDTAFAPVFAKMHPKSKFVHLRRDPVAVFKSFYSKNQWGSWQVQPITYTIDPTFRWRQVRYDVPVAMAWYIRWTEVFSRAVGRVLPDRYLEVDADKLFAQDEAEVKKLLDFIGAGMELDEAVEHFLLPYNSKAHKVAMDERAIESGTDQFRLAYTKLGGAL